MSHAGVFNLEAMAGATEELWFTDWEFGGTYWMDRTDYERWSPHRFVRNFRTPTLVIHGALDYRVPDAQGLAYYNTLKARGVDARLLCFPDENHWVLKPRNSKLWYAEFFGWLAAHAPAPRLPRKAAGTGKTPCGCCAGTVPTRRCRNPTPAPSRCATPAR